MPYEKNHLPGGLRAKRSRQRATWGWYIGSKLRDKLPTGADVGAGARRDDPQRRSTGGSRREPKILDSGKQGWPLLPMSANQHQARDGSRERVEISERKYYPTLTRRERVL